MLPAVPETVEGLAEQLAEELDLRNEARAMHWFDEMVGLIDAKGVTVPDTVLEASGQRVLTMTYIEGAKIDDLADAGVAATSTPARPSRRSSSRGSR